MRKIASLLLCLVGFYCAALVYADAPVREQLPPQITAKTILYLTHTNMDLLEMFGTLIVPLQPTFGWQGRGKQAVWQVLGYQIDKHKMFGIPLEATGGFKHFNRTLLSGYQVTIVGPKVLLKHMQLADKKGQMKMKHYKEVGFHEVAYLIVRVIP